MTIFHQNQNNTWDLRQANMWLNPRFTIHNMHTDWMWLLILLLFCHEFPYLINVEVNWKSVRCMFVIRLFILFNFPKMSWNDAIYLKYLCVQCLSPNVWLLSTLYAWDPMVSLWLRHIKYKRYIQNIIETNDLMPILPIKQLRLFKCNHSLSKLPFVLIHLDRIITWAISNAYIFQKCVFSVYNLHKPLDINFPNIILRTTFLPLIIAHCLLSDLHIDCSFPMNYCL